MKSITIKTARHALREAGLTISYREGEYRVNFRPGSEATAYYTSSLDDAVDTGLNMVHRRTMALIADLNAGRHRWSLNGSTRHV